MGHVRLVKEFLSVSSNSKDVDVFGCTPLHYASAAGHLELVRTLLEHGVSSDEWKGDVPSPPQLARECGYTEVMQLLSNVDDYDRVREVVDWIHIVPVVS